MGNEATKGQEMFLLHHQHSELYEKCMGPAWQTSVIVFMAGGIEGKSENKTSLGTDSTMFQINVS